MTRCPVCAQLLAEPAHTGCIRRLWEEIQTLKRIIAQRDADDAEQEAACRA